MLKTNSKIVKERIKELALTNKDEIIYQYDLSVSNDTELLAAIYEIYQSEKYYSDENIRRLQLSDYDVFKQWASGLPLYGTFDYFYHCTAKKTVMQILEETEDEASRFSETDAENLLTQLIYREITTAYRRANK